MTKRTSASILPTIARTPTELGTQLREKRQASGFSLRQLAPVAQCGPRFLSELERGKPTAHLAKVFDAAHALGLEFALVPRHRTEPPPGGYSQLLGTDFPYDWSNSAMEATLFIRKVLQGQRFGDLLKVIGHFGFDRVLSEARDLSAETAQALAPMLAHAVTGFVHAHTGLPPVPLAND